ncbi:hypothetical protein MSAN_01786800 [Mycena sanguinolenta]|uniref:Uncharacterized protein n=1 Tax=Mycena sanguinolenta TaxID=230812 RepID=A0A8H6XUE0_9AGAR|nr:hypothetical protein MSAN_01786800 [Mycena sanguinolenta]
MRADRASTAACSAVIPLGVAAATDACDGLPRTTSGVASTASARSNTAVSPFSKRSVRVQSSVVCSSTVLVSTPAALRISATMPPGSPSNSEPPSPRPHDGQHLLHIPGHNPQCFLQSAKKATARTAFSFITDVGAVFIPTATLNKTKARVSRDGRASASSVRNAFWIKKVRAPATPPMVQSISPFFRRSALFIPV